MKKQSKLLAIALVLALVLSVTALAACVHDNPPETETATYAVEYYFENSDGVFVKDETRTVSLSGEVGSTVTAEQITVDGYVFDANNENNVVSATLAEGTVLKLYYKLEQVSPATVTYSEQIWVERYSETEGKYVYVKEKEVTNLEGLPGSVVSIKSTFDEPHYYLDETHQDAVTDITSLQQGDVLKAYYSIERVTIVYKDNDETVNVRYGDGYTVREPEQESGSNTVVVTYSSSQTGNGTEYPIGSTITATQSITLYPIYAAAFADVDGSGDTVLIRDGFTGLGSAILIIDGERHLGFVNYTSESLITFDVTVDETEVHGKLFSENKFTYRNEDEVGMYLFYDPIFPDDGVITYITLNLDGYGIGALSYPLSDGTGRIVSYYVNYELSDEGDYYMEYYLPSAPNNVYQGYFQIVRGTIEGADELDEVDIVGYFMLCSDSEYGSYTLVYNGSIDSERVLGLDGYGNGAFYLVYDGEIDVEVTGKYYASPDYQSDDPEYVFIPDDPALMDSFNFILFAQTNPSTGDTYLFFMIKRGEAGIYTQNPDDEYPALVLNGYGYGMYYSSANDEGSLGSYTIESVTGGYEVMMTFVDEGAGTLRVKLDNVNGLFTVLDNNFRVDENGVLTEYFGTSGVIIIPSEVDGITVTAIGDNVFNTQTTANDGKQFTSITLPETITTIGERAFQNDHTLRTVYINAETPPSLGLNAFQWMRSDLYIIVPDGSLQAYRDSADWQKYADYLTSRYELAHKPEFEIRDGVLLSYNPNEDSSSDVVIPDEVTEIAAKVFAFREYITSVDLNNVTVIGDNAFDSCVNLVSVKFNKNTVSIGTYAFFNCTSLTEIDLGNIQTIGDYAFFRCYSLAKVNLGGSIQKIGTFAFSMCSVEVDEYESATELNELVLTVAATSAPQMSNLVFVNSAPRIYVDSYETGIAFANADTWALYAGYLRVKSQNVQTLFSMANVGSTLVLADNAMYDNNRNGLYKWVGNELHIAWLDRDIYTNTLTVIEQVGVYDEQTGLIRGFSYDSEPLVFVAKGTSVNYTNGNETLTITFGESAAKYNGNDITIEVVNYRTRFTYDGYIYQLSLSNDNTFTYERTKIKTDVTYTADDGSAITVTYGDSITAIGTLKNVDGNGLTVTVQYNTWNVTQVSDNTYTWEVSWRETTYKVAAVFNDVDNTFTYTSESAYTYVTYRSGQNYVVATKYADGRLDLQFNFNTANGVLSCNCKNVQAVEGKANTYAVTIEIMVDVVDNDDQVIGQVPSEFNGNYQITLNSTFTYTLTAVD